MSIFKDKTAKMPGEDELPVRTILDRRDVDFMSAAVAGLPGQRAMEGISVKHVERPRKGHGY